MTIAFGNTLNKTHLDGAGDDPAQARAELEAIIDRLNTKLATVTLIQASDLSNGGASGTVAETTGGGFPNVNADVTATDEQIQNAADKLDGYPGDIPTSGLVLIEHQDVDENTSEIDFTTGIDDTYDKYIFVIEGLVTNDVNGDTRVRTSSDGGSTWDSGASDYRYANHILNFTSSSDNGSSGNSHIAIGDQSDSSEGLSGSMAFWTGAGGLRPHTHSECTVTIRGHIGFGHRDAAVTADAVRFFTPAGSFTSGRISLYGWKS